MKSAVEVHRIVFSLEPYKQLTRFVLCMLGAGIFSARGHSDIPTLWVLGAEINQMIICLGGLTNPFIAGFTHTIFHQDGETRSQVVSDFIVQT